MRQEKKSKKHKKEKRSRKEADSDEERLARARSGKVDEAQFGRYGVLRESDLWEKRPEFIAWLTEVKGLNVEALAKWEEKEQFKARLPACLPALELRRRTARSGGLSGSP